MLLSEQAIRPHLIYPIEDHEISSSLRTLQEGFVQREQSVIDSYSFDSKLVSAYSLIYLPTNMAKFFFLMKQLSPSLMEDFNNRTFIDVGCGPGTYGLSYAHHFSRGKVIFFDTGDSMLQQSKRFWDSLVDQENFNADWVGKLSLLRKSTNSILFFGNSYNEMGLFEAIKVIERVSPEYIILLEPGTREVFSQMMKLREYLIGKDYCICYPCFSQQICPLDENKDWCHQVVRMAHHHSIERVCQIAQVDRKIMPMTAHVYRRGSLKKVEEEKDIQQGRGYRFRGETKYSFEWELCVLNSGDMHEIQRVSFLKNLMDKKILKKMKKSSVGGTFRYEIKNVLENRSVRARLVGYSAFH